MNNTEFNFLRDYSIFISGNESPAIYHMWSALSCLSSLVSRRVWTDQGIFQVHANMYCILVGDPGIKKTTAMNVARNLIREIPNIPIAPTAPTKEALLRSMCEEGSPSIRTYKHENKTVTYSHLSCFCNELTTLLGSGGNEIGYIGVLTDIWDQDKFEVKTIGRGNDFIENPFITILGCMTMETSANLVNQKIISGGFSRRCIFVYADRNGDPVPRPEVTPEQKAAWQRCVLRGKELQFISGQFKWEKSAEVFFDSWYITNHKAVTSSDSIAEKGFLQSKAGYVIKLAMLFQLGESNDMLITEQNLRQAIVMLDEVQPHVKVVFGGTGRNELNAIATAVERFIDSQAKPVAVKQVVRLFYKDANKDEIMKILDFLQAADKIKLIEEKIQDVTINCVMSTKALREIAK